MLDRSGTASNLQNTAVVAPRSTDGDAPPDSPDFHAFGMGGVIRERLSARSKLGEPCFLPMMSANEGTAADAESPCPAVGDPN